MAQPFQIPSTIISLIVNLVNQEGDYAGVPGTQRTLFNCSLINRAFYDVANPLLWRSPSIRSDGAAMRLLYSLEKTESQHGQHVRSLALYTRYWTDSTLLRLLQHVNLLQTLTIHDGTFITHRSISRIPLRCPHLELLNLNQSPVTVRSIAKLDKHAHHLRHLYLHQCTKLSWKMMTLLATCPLETLVLNVGELTGLSRPTSVDKAIRGLAGLTQLRTLGIYQASAYFSHCLAVARAPNDNNDDNDDNDNEDNGTPAWPHLTSFTLSGQYQFDLEADIYMMHFLHTHQNLSELRLLDICISDQTMEAIAFFIRNTLTFLDVSYHEKVTEEGIRRIIRASPSLNFICMEDCHVLASGLPEIGQQRLMEFGEDAHLHWLNDEDIDNIRFDRIWISDDDDIEI